jgi:hypothetical protein
MENEVSSDEDAIRFLLAGQEGLGLFQLKRDRRSRGDYVGSVDEVVAGMGVYR